jgi:uncharacterized damage-inducible protein DinB
MTRLPLFQRQAQYNRWMNRRLYAVCADIPDVDRKRDLGAFFKSVHGTFNHLLLVDRLWLGRLTEAPYAIRSLDQELYADFEALRAAREAEDQRIADYIDGLAEPTLDRTLTYRSAMTAEVRRYRIQDVLLHLFHHQTHHRGQLTTLVGQLGYDFGDTDLIWMEGVAVEAAD